MQFRDLGRADFPMLGWWLEQPHVARWWCHDWSPEGVERDFGPAVDGADPTCLWVCELDGDPIGLVQSYRIEDYPEYAAELAPVISLAPEVVSIDYLIGRPDLVGRGVGSRMLDEASALVFQRFPAAPSIVVPVSAANAGSWRALEKAGFRRVAEGELQPDNPIDDRWHVILRRDRVGGLV